jgi:hypothetical protein
VTTPNVEINLKNALVLQRNGIITSAGDGYGITYFLSPRRFWRNCGKRKKGEEIAFVLNGAMTR